MFIVFIQNTLSAPRYKNDMLCNSGICGIGLSASITAGGCSKICWIHSRLLDYMETVWRWKPLNGLVPQQFDWKNKNLARIEHFTQTGRFQLDFLALRFLHDARSPSDEVTSSGEVQREAWSENIKLGGLPTARLNCTMFNRAPVRATRNAKTLVEIFVPLKKKVCVNMVSCDLRWHRF